MYTDKQYNEISKGLKDYIIFFGYSNIGCNPKDPYDVKTKFFNYEDNLVSQKLKNIGYGFLAKNS